MKTVKRFVPIGCEAFSFYSPASLESGPPGRRREYCFTKYRFGITLVKQYFGGVFWEEFLLLKEKKVLKCLVVKYICLTFDV